MSGEGLKQSFRIGVLLFEQDDRKLDYMAEILFGLNEAGCTPFILSASLSELGMDVNRVASLVGETNADAWLVIAGSKEVLSWFANQRLPTFALFGRWGDSSIAGAGPSKAEAYREAVPENYSLVDIKELFFWPVPNGSSRNRAFRSGHICLPCRTEGSRFRTLTFLSGRIRKRTFTSVWTRSSR